MTANATDMTWFACCVSDGDRRGDHNDEEALTIASLISAAIAIPEYAGATFGVIAMVGNTQAALIDKLLRHKLTAAVYDERKLMCGKRNLYVYVWRYCRNSDHQRLSGGAWSRSVNPITEFCNPVVQQHQTSSNVPNQLLKSLTLDHFIVSGASFV